MTLPASASALRLQQMSGGLGLQLDDQRIERLLTYLGMLQRWNATYNLTAIRDQEAMLVQHLADCLSIVRPLGRQVDINGARLLDVGSGGGLPGAVLAVAMPDLRVTCIDAVGKKAAFIRQVAAELRLKNLDARHGRVELLRQPEFDVVASRAFSSLPDLVRLSSSALAPGGCWMAMKGRAPEDELARLTGDTEVFHVEQLVVPGLAAERCIVWMRRRQPAMPATL